MTFFSFWYSTVAADPFTSKLFDIYDKVWQQGISKVRHQINHNNPDNHDVCDEI